MTDHVARMVNTWFARAQATSEPRESISELVDAIHRMLREAEDDVRRRCEEVATQVGGPELGGKVALAIRTAAPESLPRKSLTEIYAPEIISSQRAH
jgi:2-oxo-4-hydroxy-4-carboxy--5-ureidoimidazoline (OHCU) decarboxylase